MHDDAESASREHMGHRGVQAVWRKHEKGRGYCGKPVQGTYGCRCMIERPGQDRQMWGTEACRGRGAGTRGGMRGIHSPESAPRRAQSQQR